MSTIQEPIQQRENTEALIADVRKAEKTAARKAAAIQKARELVAGFGLTTEEVFSNGKAAKRRSALDPRWY